MHSLLKLKRYLLHYKYQFILGLIALVIIDLMQLVVPRILKRAVDDLALGVIGVSGLALYFLWIMLLACGIAIGRFFWRYFIIGSSRKIERKLRTDFYKHLLTLDFSYFDEQKTGDLMAHAVNDINAVRMALGFGFIIFIDIFILGVAALGNMLSINPRLTFFALIPFPLIAVVSTRFGKIIHRLFEKVQESFATMTERVRESLSGIRVIKVFVQEKGEIQRFDDMSGDYVRKNVNLIRIWSMFFPSIMLLAAFGQVIVLWLGGRFVILGEISIGAFVAFNAYLQILVWPMIGIGWAINLFQRGAASQVRLNRIFKKEPAIKGGDDCIADMEGAISFNNVSFTFTSKTEPTLKNITVTIAPRQFIGITGPIGSGKSSLVNILMRLYDPQVGTVYIDGHDIRRLSIRNLRRNIAFVPQDTFLFSDTVRANIMFGNDQASDEDVERVIRIAHIYDEIMQFPNGLDTRVGERGVTLSGGQKQRIALARALLLNRPILILDDAVSSVDAETELKILDSIKQELRTRTSIVISHRVFVLKDANKIIVLDRGHVIEQGTHEELLKLNGLYCEIHKIQQIERKLKEL